MTPFLQQFVEYSWQLFWLPSWLAIPVFFGIDQCVKQEWKNGKASVIGYSIFFFFFPLNALSSHSWIILQGTFGSSISDFYMILFMLICCFSVDDAVIFWEFCNYRLLILRELIQVQGWIKRERMERMKSRKLSWNGGI